MPNQELDHLFRARLRYMYHAGKELCAKLPTIAKTAHSDLLRAALEKHAAETEEHVARLEDAFETIKEPPEAEVSEAIEGLITECLEMQLEFKNSSAFDAALISGMRAIQHYGIAHYGTLAAWAKMLGNDRLVTLFDRILSQEENAEKALMKLGESIVDEEKQETLPTAPRKQRARRNTVRAGSRRQGFALSSRNRAGQGPG